MTSHPARTLPALISAVLAVALLASGCAPSTNSSSNSTSKFKGDARLAAQTVEDLQSAADDGDEAQICDELLARAFAGRVAASGGTCPDGVEEAIKDADSIDMTVESVQVSGDQATARVRLETGKNDRRATVRLVRENRRWKIADL